MADHIERIILQADESQAVDSVSNANAALEQYEQVGTTANRQLGKSFEVVEGGAKRSADQIDRHNRQLDITEKRLIVVQRATVDRTRAEDRLVAVQNASADSSVRAAAAEAKLAAVHQTVADGTHAVWKAFGELVGILGTATTAYASNKVAVDGAVNSYRALRLVYSPTPFTVVTIAAGLMLETMGKLIIAQDKLIQQDAVLSAKKEVGGDVTTSFRQSLNGTPGLQTADLIDAFKKLDAAKLDAIGVSVIDSAGHVKEAGLILGESLRTISEIKDPTERVKKLFDTFGVEIGEKLLPHLNSRLEENARFVRDWSIALPESAKQTLDETARDLNALGAIFDSTIDKTKLQWRRYIDIHVAGFAELYVAMKDGYKLIASIKAPPTFLGFGGSLASIDTSTEGPEAAVAQAKAMIAKLGAASSDSTIKALDLNTKQLSQNVDRIVSERSKTLDGLQAALDAETKRLEKALSNRTIGGGNGLLGALLDREIVRSSERVAALQKEVDAAKAAADAKKKSAQEIENAEKRAHEILVDAQKGEFTGLARIIDQYRIYRRELGLSTAANRDLAQAAQIRLQVEAQKELKKNADETVKGLQDDLQNDLAFRQKKFAAAQQYEKETLDLELKTLDDQYEYGATLAQQSRDSQLRFLDSINAQTVAQKIAVEHAKFDIERDYLNKVSEIEVAQLEHRRDREIALQKALAEAGVISASEFARRQDALIDASSKQAERKVIDTQAAIQGAAENAAIKSSEILRDSYQRTFDSIQRSAQGLLDGFLTHSQSVGDAIKNIFKAAFLTPIENGLSNQIAAKLTGLITGQKVTLETQQVEGTGTVAGIRRFFAALGVGAQPKFSKLEAPNHLGDVSLIRGAVPVMVMNQPGQDQGSRQIAQQAASAAPFGLGAILGLGLGSLGTLGAKTVGSGGGSLVTSTITGEGGKIIGSGATGGLFSGADSSNPLIFHALGEGKYDGQNIIGHNGIPLGSGLRSFFGFGDYSVPLNGGGASTGTAILQSGSIGQKLTALGRSNAALLGGGILAADGLRRGGLAGLGETTAGGALIGFKFGGPVGALIGGAVGLAAGIGRLFYKSFNQQIIERVQQKFNLKIDNGTASQIAAITKQTYGGSIARALDSSEVQDLLSLYAQNTGQKFGLKNEPRGVSLTGSASGAVTQDAIYSNGSAYAFDSKLGVTGGVATQPIYSFGMSPTPYQFGPPAVSAPSSGSSDVARLAESVATLGDAVQKIAQRPLEGTFKFDGAATVAAFQGEAVKAVASNPRVVVDATSSALKGNYGVSKLRSTVLAPGVIAG